MYINCAVLRRQTLYIFEGGIIMKTINKAITLVLTTVMLLTTVIPSFAVNSQGQGISITRYVSTILDTLQIPYTDPLQEAVNQKWVSKGHKLISKPSASITKEQSAQFIYGVLRTKEGVKPDLYYERILTYFMGDVNQIDPSYRRAVFTTIMNGFYEPQLKNEKKYFNPKTKVTEAEMKVMMGRLVDKGKRYDPFQMEHAYDAPDRSKSWGSAPTVKIVYPNIVYPKLSTIKKQMTFKDGFPVEDKSMVLKELDEEERNRYEMAFLKYYKYNDYLNKIAFMEQGVLSESMAREKRMAEVDHWYEVATKFTNSYFNVDYKNTKKTEAALKAVMPSRYGSQMLIKDYTDLITKNKIKVQGYMISDKTLFYDGFNISFVRTRVYFKTNSTNKIVPFRIATNKEVDPYVNLKSNTWYYVDLDIAVGGYVNYEGDTWSWNGDAEGVGGFQQVSDVIEITPKSN